MVLEQQTYIFKKKKKNLYLTLHAKINSKRIIDLNVNQKTVTFFKKTREKNLYDLGLHKEFLDTTPKA